MAPTELSGWGQRQQSGVKAGRCSSLGLTLGWPFGRAVGRSRSCGPASSPVAHFLPPEPALAMAEASAAAMAFLPAAKAEAEASAEANAAGLTMGMGLTMGTWKGWEVGGLEGKREAACDQTRRC